MAPEAPVTHWSTRYANTIIAIGFGLLWALAMTVVWTRWQSESENIEFELRKDTAAELRAKAIEIEGILQRTYHTIRTISLLPGARSALARNRISAKQNAVAMGYFSAADFGTVQQLYNHIAATVEVSEIYIVHDGFRPDVGQVPFLMFDEVIVQKIAHNQVEIENKNIDDVPKEDESEEYADYVRQLDYLRSKYPKLPANAPDGIVPINSGELRTCDNVQYTSIARGDVKEARGFTLSVPLFDLHSLRFKGLVTAVLRRNIFEAALRGIPEVPIALTPGAPLVKSAAPVNFVLEQQSSNMRIFDRTNEHLKVTEGQIGSEFFHDKIKLRMPGDSVWTLHTYVSEDQHVHALAVKRKVTAGQAILLTVALGLAWLFVYILLRRQSTARHQAEQLAHSLIVDLERQTQIAQAASVSKSQFLANMSHEIRTPMNAIMGMLTLLRKTELTPRQAEYAAKSDGAARSLLSLLNEILDFSKIEAGKMELDLHSFAMDQLLRDLSVILSTTLGQKSVEILFDVAPTLPDLLIGDSMRLQQVLLNLGSNAVKFTEQGEVVVSIVEQYRTDTAINLQFSVSDTGIGIAPDNQARIFGGFTQAESSTTRRFGGTGLGVAISQRFVSMMGGTLKLESELGKGSRFYFDVTLQISQSSSSQEHQRAHQLEHGKSWRILVIDDSAAARDVMLHMGQSLGWHVDLAASGEQALRLVAESTHQHLYYQAIFVDWQMSGMDGWQTMLHIRDLQSHDVRISAHNRATVIAMVTAYGRDLLSQSNATDQVLIDGIVVKPVTASILFEAVVDARNGQVGLEAQDIQEQPAKRRLEGMHLLLAEDNLNNQQVARELLESEGARVEIANDGQEAVDAIANASPAFDVVLIDLHMPVMDGFAVAHTIRNALGMATLPIVAMTANAMLSDREACLAAGMNAHVGKPFDLDALVDVLREHAHWAVDATAPTANIQLPSPKVLQAADVASVDILAALHRLGGRLDIYRFTLRTFVDDLRSIPDELRHALKEGSMNADAVLILHALKGQAATLGHSALASATAAAEKSMGAGPTRKQLLASCDQVCHAVARALPSLQGLLHVLQQESGDGAKGA